MSAGDLLVAGIDEAGRGPWAGPVIAAAVVASVAAEARLRSAGVADSKRLTRHVRERCLDEIVRARDEGLLWFAVGRAEVAEIDTLNILQATMTAMTRAVDALPTAPAHALVDGDRLPKLPCPGETVIGGDASVISIGAASIVAKVMRDREMARLAATHPGYGWERNAGYGTPEHRRGLKRLGVTVHHRRSFAPIRVLLERIPIPG